MTMPLVFVPKSTPALLAGHMDMFQWDLTQVFHTLFAQIFMTILKGGQAQYIRVPYADL